MATTGETCVGHLTSQLQVAYRSDHGARIRGPTHTRHSATVGRVQLYRQRDTERSMCSRWGVHLTYRLAAHRMLGAAEVLEYVRRAQRPAVGSPIHTVQLGRTCCRESIGMVRGAPQGSIVAVTSDPPDLPRPPMVYPFPKTAYRSAHTRNGYAVRCAASHRSHMCAKLTQCTTGFSGSAMISSKTRSASASSSTSPTTAILSPRTTYSPNATCSTPAVEEKTRSLQSSRTTLVV